MLHLSFFTTTVMGPKPKSKSKAVTEVDKMAHKAILEAISRHPSGMFSNTEFLSSANFSPTYS